KQDLFYFNELVASFVPKMSRAILTRVEADVLGCANEQKLEDKNMINGFPHRFVGSATGERIALADIALAKLALDKANVPPVGRVAIVDPSVEYVFNTLTNLTNVINNPMFEGIVTTGFATGMRFYKNIFGFDIYISNY